MLSCLLILGTKRCMLCWLLVFGGPKCDNHVSGFASSVRFVNVQRTACRHPQVCWNSYPLLIGGLDHGQWTSSLGYFYVQIVATIFTCVDYLTKYTVLTACTVGVEELSAKQVAQMFF